jgi:predicted nucleic acid-binding protein
VSVGFLATTPRRTSGRIFGTRKVIVDSSTLIHLSAIGRFALLKDLYGQLTVTPAVWREVVEQGKDRTGVTELEAARQQGWLGVQMPANQPLLHSLRHELDEGEAEVIALAVEHQGSLALLDESDARRVASSFGIEKTGAIGVLIRARLEGRIDSLRAELDKIRTQAGFWIEDGLYQKVVEAAGE